MSEDARARIFGPLSLYPSTDTDHDVGDPNAPNRLSLTAFLSARLDDDEAVARTAEEMAGSVKWATDSPNISRYGHYVQTEDTRIYTAGLRLSLHIARHDPARVLADVEAKRKIVALHRAEVEHADVRFEDFDVACFTCGQADEYPVEWPCPTLRLLALPYADHPDYDPSWVVS